MAREIKLLQGSAVLSIDLRNREILASGDHHTIVCHGLRRTGKTSLLYHMQHEEKLILLFCGTHKLEEMSADYWSIFFNTAIYYRLSHLHYRDALRLIKEPVKGQLAYDDLAVEQIMKMTGGQGSSKSE